MSEFETDRPLGEAPQTAAEEAPQCEPEPRPPLWRRILFGAFVTIAVLAFVAGLLYRFGSMWTPSAETQAAYEQLRAQGAAPEIEQRFHIPIPGCVCHSDDPVLTMQHSTRRVSECMGCHGG